MTGDVNISDDAVRGATGHGWDHWMAHLDAYPVMEHTPRVKSMCEAFPDLAGWWAQMITVEWERRRGLREVGQTCAGDYQVSCSKTVAMDAMEAFERVISTPFLAGADWSEGATWENDEARIEVRRVDPGKIVRWFWFDEDGKSTVECDFWPTKAEDKMQIRFGHSQLASLEAREKYRARWKEALEQITA